MGGFAVDEAGRLPARDVFGCVTHVGTPYVTEKTAVTAGRYMPDRLNETAIPRVVLPIARYRRGPKEDVVRHIASRVVAVTSLAVILVACSGTTSSQPPAATES